MIYILIFTQVICFYFLIKKGIQIRKQKRAFMQLELEKGRVHDLLKNMAFNKSVDVEVAVLEYFKQNLTVEEHSKGILVYASLTEHFENKQPQKL